MKEICQKELLSDQLEISNCQNHVLLSVIGAYAPYFCVTAQPWHLSQMLLP